MAEFAFFSNRTERWKRDLVTLWGNFDICPHLNHLDLPSHSPVQLISVSSFKVWGNIQDPQHNMACLLVCLGDTTEERQYGVSLVWVNPNQTRASTMEEAVEKLATCPSSGTNWPYALGTAVWGFWSCTTPQGQTPGHPASRKGRGNLLWADQSTWHPPAPFCQSQVVYPSGLNGHDEPIITILPESLSSSVSIIASDHPYLEIDIPPKGESDTKVLPIGKASIIQTTDPHKSPHNPKGNMTAEVNHLLDWVIMEASSGRSEQSSLEKITTEDPPQKSEVIVPPVDMSSQASIKEAEGSLEDIPANISLIAAVYSSGSASPLVDLSELQANANRAIDNMLHLKRSLDVKRQRATWELGVLLCQNKSRGHINCHCQGCLFPGSPEG